MSFELIIFLMLTTVPFEIQSQINTIQFDFKNAIIQSNTYLEKLVQDQIFPGLVAGISINGSQVWTKGFGFTDIENGVITRVDSVWRLASISKSLTSALVAKLIDAGHLDLDKPINYYLRQDVFPNKKWNNNTVNITLGQVMSHTAGLHVMDWPQDLYNRLDLKNVTETVQQFKDKPLIFMPGTNFNYSNYGYQVVGAVIESVLNQTLESAINKFFKDLQMNTTFCERREQIISHRARYYTRFPQSDQGKIVNTDLADDLVSFDANWPSGGIVSSVPDLLKFGDHIIKWSNGLNASKIVNVKKATIDKIWSPVFQVDGIPPFIPSPSQMKYGKYAHGWFVTELNKPIICSWCKFSPIKQIIYHPGTLDGVQTMLALEPLNQIVFTQMANCPSSKIFEMFTKILQYFCYLN